MEYLEKNTHGKKIMGILKQDTCKYMYIWKIEILFQARVLLGNSNSWGETTKAFIFSLNNTEGLAPFVSKVKKEFTGDAIYRNSSSGPRFGIDVIIVDNADSSGLSRARLNFLYSVPPAVKVWSTVLAGTLFFSPNEVEVFYLDPSR